jgi:serine/threonine protein kinase
VAAPWSLVGWQPGRCRRGGGASSTEVTNRSTARAAVRQIVDGVDYLHSQHVIHRDLKPENLLMQRHGDGFRIKVGTQ